MLPEIRFAGRRTGGRLLHGRRGALTRRSQTTATVLYLPRFLLLDEGEEVLALDGFGVGGGVFGEGEAHGLAPAAALAMEGVAGGGVGHGDEPPTFLRGEAAPIGDGDRDEGGVGILDGPGE